MPIVRDWRRAGVPILLLTLLGAFLRFFYIGHQGLWYDESYTSFLVKFSPGKMLGLIPSQESTPPLFYCVEWVWVRIFANTPAGLRSLSAVCGTITIPLVYVATRKLLKNERAALIATALTAFNPLLIWYSQEARAYSMMVMFSAASLVAFAYVVECPQRKAVAAWAVLSILALATHYYAGLLVVPEAGVLLWRYRDKPRVWIAVAAVMAGGVALLPLIEAQTNTGNLDWIGTSSLSLRLKQIVPLFLIGTGSPARVLLKWIAFVVTFGGLALLVLRTPTRERRIALAVGGLGVAGFVLSLLLIASGHDTLLTRNLLPLWLPAAIAVAAGFAAPRARVLGLTLAAVLCGIGIFAVIGIDTNYYLQRPNWVPLTNTIGQWPGTSSQSITQLASGGPKPDGVGRLIVVQRNSTAEFPMALYLNGLRDAYGTSWSDIKEIDFVAVYSPPSGGLCWWGAGCNMVHSRIFRSYPVPGFKGTPRQTVEQFTLERLTSTKPRDVTRAELVAVLKWTKLKHCALLIQRSSQPA